jgi:hypothetical protein
MSVVISLVAHGIFPTWRYKESDTSRGFDPIGIDRPVAEAASSYPTSTKSRVIGSTANTLLNWVSYLF